MDWERMFWGRILIAVPEFRFDRVFKNLLESQGIIPVGAMDLGADAMKKARGFINFSTKMRDATLIERILMVAPELLSVRSVDLLRKFDLISVEMGHLLRLGLQAKGLISPIFAPEKTFLERVAFTINAVFTPELINFIRDIDVDNLKLVESFLKMDRMKSYDEQLAFIEKEIWRLKRVQTVLPNWEGWTEADLAEIKLFGADRNYINRLKAEAWAAKESKRIFDKDFLTWVADASVRRANLARLGVSLADRLIVALSTKSVNGPVWDVITIMVPDLFSDKMLGLAMRAGVLGEREYNTIIQLRNYGMLAWQNLSSITTGVTRAMKYEGFMARALMISEGVITHEMLEMLYRHGLIKPGVYQLLRPAVTIVRDMIRQAELPYMKSTRMRLDPAMNPLQVFLRKTQMTDRELMKLLQEAGADAGRQARALAEAKKIGGRWSAGHQRTMQNEMYRAMRRLYENVGYLTIIGERQAAVGAADAMDLLNSKIWGKNPRMQSIRRMYQMQARAGIESYVSRHENLLRIATRIYKNGFLSEAQISREISKALLRNLSASEFAKNVANLYRPDVPGGISYASLRLARTEINNAFHSTTVRYTREAPWVQGYQWNRSGRRDSTCDPCGSYANDDHESMGRGVFSKGNVPGKPHPQCLCYLTTITMGAGDFEKRFRSGAFDTYLDGVAKHGFYEDAWREAKTRNVTSALSQINTSSLTTMAAQLAIGVAANKISSMLS